MHPLYNYTALEGKSRKGTKIAIVAAKEDNKNNIRYAEK